MVKALYELGGVEQREETLSTDFLLTNKKGGYFLESKDTIYRGFHILDVENGLPSLFKTIDSICICRVPSEIINKFWCIEKKYAPETTERFFMHENGLLYEVENYEGYSLLTLDMRKINDYSNEGHDYKFYDKNGFFIIEYSKFKDAAKTEKAYTKYIVIKTDAKIENLSKWVNKTFEYDKRRGDVSERFVFEALRFHISNNGRIVFYSGTNLEVAMNNANYLYYSNEHLKNQKKEYIKRLTSNNIMVSKRIGMAYKRALKSLDDLTIEINEQPMIYAGLPWFYQIWTRDEAISLKALMLEKEYEKVKKIIFRQLKIILKDGRIPNRYPPSQLSSADGVGWVFKRIYDFVKLLQKRGELEKVLSREDMLVIKEKISESLNKLIIHRTRDGLAINGPKETWMDTDYGGDERDGARIEIQSLRLCMYSFAGFLSKYLEDKDQKKYRDLEKNMRLKVRQDFFERKMLKDGSTDKTLRPNVFLAHYIYPDLLSSKEWEQAFKYCINNLFLPWGGFSTIEKSSPLYSEYYTGMDNKSYHRGDSWYFVNNLAAISLKKVNYDMFYNVIVKIVEASTEEILAKGVMGVASELSSAKELRSEGCLSQAWSSATYIELVHELFENATDK